MNCPIDNTPLAFAKQQGVEIDYCPKCRGVWLDREKLDLLIEQSGRASSPTEEQNVPPQGQKPSPVPSPQGHKLDIAGIVGDLINQGLEEHRQSSKSSGQSKRKKKGSLLGRLFDF